MSVVKFEVEFYGPEHAHLEEVPLEGRAFFVSPDNSNGLSRYCWGTAVEGVQQVWGKYPKLETPAVVLAGIGMLDGATISGERFESVMQEKLAVFVAWAGVVGDPKKWPILAENKVPQQENLNGQKAQRFIFSEKVKYEDYLVTQEVIPENYEDNALLEVHKYDSKIFVMQADSQTTEFDYYVLSAALAEVGNPERILEVAFKMKEFGLFAEYPRRAESETLLHWSSNLITFLTNKAIDVELFLRDGAMV